MTLYESGEMYLETILLLSKKQEKVRAIDISNYMNFTKPSVSRGLSILKNQGHIEVAGNGAITLTDSGREIAEKIYERHVILQRCFMAIGISEETAERDACRIEHVISDESFDAIKDHFLNK